MKGKWIGVTLVSAAMVVGVGEFVMRPAAVHYVEPLVREQLNTALTGKAQFDDLSIAWNGTVKISNVVVSDEKGARVIGAPAVLVSVSPWEALKLSVGAADAVELISKVSIKDADIHLWENPDKSWNIARLVKSKDSESPTKFKGLVELDGSTVYLATAKGSKIRLDDLSAGVKFAQYPTLTAAVRTTVDGVPIEATGRYENTKDSPFSLFVKANGLDANYINEFISPEWQLHINEGRLNNIDVTIDRDKSGYHLKGGLDIDKGHINYQDYNVTNGTIHISLDDKLINLERGSFYVNDQLLTVAGNLDIGENPLGMNLHLHGDSIQVEQVLPKRNITGLTKADVYIKGNTEKPNITGTLRIDELQYDAYQLQKGYVDFSYQNKIAIISKLETDINDGHLQGNGWYNLSDSSYEFYGESNNLPLALLGSLTNKDISGEASGKVYVKGQSDRIDELVAAVEGKEISYEGMMFDTLSTTVYGREGTYEIPYFNATAGEGALTAYGKVSGDTSQINFYGTDLPLNLLDGVTGHELTGKGNISGTLTGALNNPTCLDGKVSSHGGTIDGLHFDELYGDVFLQDQLLTIKRGDIQDGEGVYDLSGSIGLDGNKALDLDVGVTNVRIENTLKPISDIPLTGYLSATTHIGGTMDNPLVTGEAHMWDGSAYGKLISEAKARYTYQNKILNLSELSLTAYGATVTGSGTVNGKNIDIAFAGQQMQVASLAHQFKAEMTGLVDLVGTIKGTTDAPILQADIKTPELLINGSHIRDLQGSLYMDPSVINLSNLSFAEGEDGHYQVQGGMSLKADKKLFGQATVSNGNIEHFLRLMKIDIPNLSGKLNGHVELGGTKDSPDVSIKGEISNTTIGKKVLGASKIDMDLSHRRLTIRQLSVPVEKGVIAAEGTADLDGKANIQVAALNVPIADFIPLTGRDDIQASGLLNVTANITGETQNPKVEFSGDLENGVYNGVALDHIYILGNMEDKIVSFQQILVEKGIYKLKAFGKIPLAAFDKKGILPPGDKSGMDLTLDMNNADLGILPILSTAIEKGEGPIEGTIHLGGSVDAPQVMGSVAIKDGLVHVKGLDTPISHINGRLDFEGQTSQGKIVARLGKGMATVNGQANWKDFPTITYTTSLQLDKADIQSKYFKGPLTGTLTYASEGATPKLSGTVNLEKDIVDIPLMAEDEGQPIPLRLDVTVNAGDEVRLYNSMLYDMYLGGSAHFRGTLAKPYADGEFVVKKGYFKYLNTRFKIENGVAKFEPGSFLPYLTLSAQARLQNYTINMALNGPVSKLDIKLTSNPALSEQQIVSLLTFKKGGNMSSGINSDDANALLIAGLQSVAFGSVEGMLQDRLGLDLINITTGSLDTRAPINKETAGYYNIEIGKYLLPNLMATVSKGLNNDLLVYGIQYEINSNFSVNAWKNNKDNSYLGAQWRYKF